MVNIFGTILHGAELAFKTIFEIQFQISRQTYSQLKLTAGHVLFFQHDYDNSNVMKHYVSILSVSSEKLC